MVDKHEKVWYAHFNSSHYCVFFTPRHLLARFSVFAPMLDQTSPEVAARHIPERYLQQKEHYIPSVDVEIDIFKGVNHGGWYWTFREWGRPGIVFREGSRRFTGPFLTRAAAIRDASACPLGGDIYDRLDHENLDEFDDL